MQDEPFESSRISVSSAPSGVGVRVALVGACESLDQLEGQVRLLDPRPEIVCRVPCGVPRRLGRPGVAGPGEAVRLQSGGGDRGCGEELEHLAEIIRPHGPVDLVLLSLPLVMRSVLEQMIEQLERAGLAWRFIPTLADQFAGRVKPPVRRNESSIRGCGGVELRAGVVSEHDVHEAEACSVIPGPDGLWNVDPVQLLGRRPKPLDLPGIQRSIEGRCVLITGSGGSIGSELARMVCQFHPSQIVLVDRAENPLFEVDRQIGASFPGVRRVAVLHDVTDAPGTLALIRARRPDVVLHAAAHKHVPMMEEHPAQAIENNFYGTRSIADAADAVGVERFVMISTDKAVNPSSVMGATKRLAELYIQHLNAKSRCVFCMVRFGNVLGSACSVLPIWSRQLASGGPITVTHPEMQRYFMTIPEAAGLVLQAMALSQGGEVFLLDMGQPVGISDLARRFVQSQGLRPDADVAIEFTGIRPGEKLYEELAYDGEDMLATSHPSIRTWLGRPADPALMGQILSAFDRLRAGRGGERIWQRATKEALLTALRWAIPEMVHAAVG